MRTFVLLVACSLVIGGALAQGTDLDSLHDDINSKSDVALTLQPNFDKWQQMLMPAPTVISLLGEMVVISSKIDVSLTSVTPIGGWRHVNHPESLRASLLQIGHDGWSGFRVAQRNMDEIQLNMAMVPKHVKTALRVIERMPARMVARVLPKALNRIGDAAELSFRLANRTETIFVEVMDLVGEIEGAVASTSGVVERNLTDTKVKLTFANVTRMELRKQQALTQKRYDKIEKEMDQARQSYEDAIDDIPTGFKAIAMDLVKSFVGIIKKVTGTDEGNGGGGPSGAGTSAGTDAGMTDTIMLNMANTLQQQVNGLPQIVGELESKTADAGAMTTLKVMTREFLKNIAGYAKTIVKQKVTAMYSKVQDFADKVEKAAKDINGVDQATLDTYKQKAAELVDEGRVLVAAAATTGAEVKSDASDIGGPQGGSFQNEYYVVKVRLNELQNAQRRSDKTFERLTDLGQKVAQVEAEVAALDITRINLKDILKMLKQVIKLLGQMREQWSYLIQFFSDVTTRAKMINNQVVKPFLSDTTDFVADLRDEDRLIVLQMVTEMASDVETASFFLQEIAGTYVRISSKYLLGPLAGLGKMLAAETDAERSSLRAQLYAKREEAKQGVIEEIDRVRTSYNRRLQQRQDELRAYGDALGLPPSDQQRSDQLINEGVLLADSIGKVIA